MKNEALKKGDRVKVEHHTGSGSYVGEGDIVKAYVGWRGCGLLGSEKDSAPNWCYVSTEMGILTVPVACVVKV